MLNASAAQPAVVGLGAITAHGVGVEALWLGLLAGHAPFSERAVDLSPLASRPPVLAAHVPPFDVTPHLGKKGVRFLNRESRFFMSAATIALSRAGLDPKAWTPVEVAVFVATLFAGLDDYTGFYVEGLVGGPNSVSPSRGPQTGYSAPASQLAIHIGCEAANITIPAGPAAGLEALVAAAGALREDRARIAVAGAVESISYYGLAALESAGWSFDHPAPPRPFDRRRTRPAPGEAGVALVLEEPEHARERGAIPLARVLGSAACAQVARAEDSLREALDRANLGPAGVSAVVASASGHPENDALEAEVLAAVFGESTPVAAIKGSVGECLGASPALQCAVAVLAIAEGVLPGTTGFSEPDPALPRLALSTAPVRGPFDRVAVTALDAAEGFAVMILERDPGD